MPPRTAAVVGAVGGAGATRLTVEIGATLARDDRDVAVFDAAFATQGLARYVDGRVEPDVTELVAATDADHALADALVDHDADVPGRLAVCPAYAPFERLARAKSRDAAEAFERRIEDAAAEFDHVLVDTPPVAANQAVASATAADRVAVVTRPTDRGVDGLQRARGRLADLDAGVDLVIANRASDGSDPPDADVAVPESPVTDADTGPASPAGRSPFAPAVADAAATLFDVDLDLSFGGGVLDVARRRLR